MQNELPHSPAAQRNKNVILDELKALLMNQRDVMEIGHGTGEHALYFAQNLDHIQWYPYDTKDYNWILKEKMKVNSPKNLHDPCSFHVRNNQISPPIEINFDTLYCANVFHIMHEQDVKYLCGKLHELIKEKIILYGPYKFDGNFTSESNQHFDQSLKARDPEMGIRNIEDIQLWLKKFKLQKNISMPANNNLLLFERTE